MSGCTILMNGKAGALKKTADADEMRRLADEVGLECVIEETESIGEFRERLKDLAATPGNRIVVAGGDGTIHNAVQCLAGTEAVLGILPQGTANNFAHALRLPEDLPSALRVLKDGKVKEVDLGYVDGHYFTEAAGVGLFADALAMYGGANKNLWRSLVTLLRLIFSMSARRIRLSLDGQVISERAVMCTVANSYRIAHALPVAPDAKVTDGVLDVVVLGDLKRSELITYYRAIRNQLHLGLEKVSHHQGTEIKIESRRKMNVHVDDQVIGTTPVTIKALPKALKVLVEQI